ncbi:porin [Aestuariicoccus sp. MJ-SS9]|uniref:porin n=1 Tax=Aestuariicoccus sp. MJ-SS9 TaxID=3079855 RepID=UPI00290C27F7|nr:porin [Aestuariicoccus sp. MJ-SS9]MDU8912923.1 porin [Aestuariicoccus sp. MJ-SS9]
MKNILLATTALVATAGIASAEVALSGYAELGIFQNENDSGDGASPLASDTTRVFTDIDVTFSMTGEADNGLTFGASIDLDELDGDGDTSDAARLPDSTIFMAFGPMTLTVGDTDSAFDARLTETAIGGAINDDHTVHPGYNGNSALDEAYGGQEIRLDYAFDSFTASVSMSPDRFDNFDPSFAVGVSYNAELAGLDLGVGLGYIQVDESAFVYDQIIGLSLSTTFNNGLQGILNYSHWTDDSTGGADDASHMAVGLGYSMNALTIGFNYGVYDLPGGDVEGYGLAVNYDLGGGLVAQLGYGAGDDPYEDTFSLGVAMSF